MTEVRLVGRTHYQVLEPALLRSLVQSCTSPVSSAFRDQVARKLSGSQRDLNVVAAGYAVDLGKALRLVRGNLVWTNLGHLLNITAGNHAADSWRELNEAERIVFFRLFLEFDGAALIFFAKKIERQSKVPDQGESWTGIAQDLFQSTYEEYLKFVTGPAPRIRLRQLLERRRRRPFQGKSGTHQSFLHIHTLHRLLLVEQIEEGTTRVYKGNFQVDGMQRPTRRLIGAIPDLMTLERIVDAGTCYDVVGEVLGYAGSGQEMHDTDFMDKVRSVYRDVMATGVAICPIQTVAEAIQVQSVMEHRKPPGIKDILARLKIMQRYAPRKIRLHVDRFGFPAYIKMD